jgi:hypothetical protein
LEQSLDASVTRNFPAGSPTHHVRSQIKEALADMIQIFQADAYPLPDGETLTAENAYSIYCADFILDHNVDVWLTDRPRSQCNLDEDHYFRLDLHASMLEGMTAIMEEVWEKQEASQLVMPLGNLGNWEILYADGLRFQYHGYNVASRNDPTKKNGISTYS